LFGKEKEDFKPSSSSLSVVAKHLNFPSHLSFHHQSLPLFTIRLFEEKKEQSTASKPTCPENSPETQKSPEERKEHLFC